MRNERGFTLIELVVVIVILGILAAVAVPKFVDLSAQATAASKEAMVGAVKSAFAMTVASKAVNAVTPIYPTVTELVAAMEGGSGTAVATGVQVVIKGANYTVLTFSDTTCATPTAAVTTVVQCVSGITP